MYHLKECIVVEGVYDKIKLSNIVDSPIFVTHGFSVFNNKDEIKTLKTLAEKIGVVILTDSDSAGFKIRSFVKNSLPADRVKHAYIPEVSGKERRKNKAGKEGLLGVEGISDEIIVTALKNAGCTLFLKGENDSTDPHATDTHIADSCSTDPHIADSCASNPHTTDRHIADSGATDPHIADSGASDPHTTDRHIADSCASDPHTTDRHIANSGAIDRHIADSGATDPHIADPCATDRHIADSGAIDQCVTSASATSATATSVTSVPATSSVTATSVTPSASVTRVTKADFFALGLSGGEDSYKKRAELAKRLGLPGKISSNMLISAINSMMSKEQLEEILKNGENLTAQKNRG